MKFWDASAIVPLCLDEPQTELLRPVLEHDRDMVAWWGTVVECASAYARRRRDDALTRSEEVQARDVLGRLSTIWTEIEPSAEIRDQAFRLLSLHPLRAADSLQLAAALIWAGRNPKGQHFVCLDGRLRQAAQQEGFTLVPD